MLRLCVGRACRYGFAKCDIALALVIRPNPPAEEEEALKQALLGSLNENCEAGHDVENPAPKKGRSWYSLFGSALVFVWPDDWVLQVEALPCFIAVCSLRPLCPCS